MSALTAKQASELLRAKPLFRRSDAERRVIVDALEGRLVSIYEDNHRDGNEVELVGVVLGITSNPGVGAALVVLRTERGSLLALSSARVSRIEVRK